MMKGEVRYTSRLRKACPRVFALLFSEGLI